jgi:hypothetical protein
MTEGPTSNFSSPGLRLSLAITGHRDSNPAYAANRDQIKAMLTTLFTALDGATKTRKPTRLNSLLAVGADLVAVELALDRGWDVAAPLPFGLALNIAINAQPTNVEDAKAILMGTGECTPAVAARAAHIRRLAERVHRFELAEQDARITPLFLASLDSGDDAAVQAFAVAGSERAAMAGQVMLEQADILIAIWDGKSPGPAGGTRHTIVEALGAGLPVLWLDASRPGQWRLLQSPEAMAIRDQAPPVEGYTALQKLVSSVLGDDAVMAGADLFHAESWQRRSVRRYHAYRRIEALFGGGAGFRSLVQHYEAPARIADGSAADMLAAAHGLPGGDAAMAQRLESDVMRRFAWADGLATWLSDAYRGGMVINLLMSAFAIIGGVAYLPFASAEWKWPFALFEFILLTAILVIIWIGRRKRWHDRWFDTRRVAEYLRHAPIMLLLGVTRPAADWPRGAQADWPEIYVRAVLREIGLPRIALTSAYLRAALVQWLDWHVVGQRDYHRGKAERLNRVHRNLERFSEMLFMLAVGSVAIYLLVVLAGYTGLVPREWGHDWSKPFTFLGVLFPTSGGALAGIHYFGDFERFAAISESTANRLSAIDQRIRLLLTAPDGELHYARVADIAHEVDEIVISEISHWQDVFAGKHISVPV